MSNHRLLRCTKCNQQTMHEHLSLEEIENHHQKLGFRFKEFLAAVHLSGRQHSSEMSEYRCTICRTQGG